MIINACLNARSTIACTTVRPRQMLVVIVLLKLTRAVVVPHHIVQWVAALPHITPVSSRHKRYTLELL